MLLVPTRMAKDDREKLGKVMASFAAATDERLEEHVAQHNRSLPNACLRLGAGRCGKSWAGSYISLHMSSQHACCCSATICRNDGRSWQGSDECGPTCR